MNILSIDCDWVKNLEQQTLLLSHCLPIIRKTKNYYAYNHHMILKCFDVTKSQEINLTNIDDHHDYAYTEFNEIECANWLFHLSQREEFLKKINYFWVGNCRSEMPRHKVRRMMDNTLQDYQFTFDISEIHKFKYDTTFVCASIDYQTPYGLSTYKILENFIKCN